MNQTTQSHIQWFPYPTWDQPPPYKPTIVVSLQMNGLHNGLTTCLLKVFATKMQLENLTHMFCPLISFWKLYNKGDFSYVFHIKNMGHW